MTFKMLILFLFIALFTNIKSEVEMDQREKSEEEFNKASVARDREEIRSLKDWLDEMDKYLEHFPEENRKKTLDDLRRIHGASREPKDDETGNVEPIQRQDLIRLVWGVFSLLCVVFWICILYRLYTKLSGKSEIPDNFIRTDQY